LDDAFGYPYRSQDKEFVFIVDIHVESTLGIYAPVPLRFALERARAEHLPLQLDNKMFEQVGNLSGLAFALEGKAVIVLAAMAGEVWEQLEEELRDMRGMLGGVSIGVGHLNN
jgi:hypothetical protein